jgi:hypothetical protein
LYHSSYYSRNRAQSTIVQNNKVSGNYNKTYSKPETRQQGAADFTQKHQNSTRPSFPTKNNSNGNVIHSDKPVNNGNVGTTKKPETNTKPQINSNTKPAKPSTTNTKPQINTNKKPAKPSTSKPYQAKPSKPKPTAPKPSAPKPMPR